MLRCYVVTLFRIYIDFRGQENPLQNPRFEIPRFLVQVGCNGCILFRPKNTDPVPTGKIHHNSMIHSQIVAHSASVKCTQYSLTSYLQQISSRCATVAFWVELPSLLGVCNPWSGLIRDVHANGRSMVCERILVAIHSKKQLFLQKIRSH